MNNISINAREVLVISPNDERNWIEYNKRSGEFHVYKYNEHYATFDFSKGFDRMYFNDEQAIEKIMEAMEEEGL